MDPGLYSMGHDGQYPGCVACLEARTPRRSSGKLPLKKCDIRQL